MGPWIMIVWVVVISATFAAGLRPAGCDPVLGSNRPADTHVRDQIKHYRSDEVPETYFFPLPNTCPRTAVGHARWDLC